MKTIKAEIPKTKQLTVIARVCAAILGCGLLGVSLPSQSEVTISGHVAYNAVDRDSEEDLVFQRNGFTESRFRLVYKKDLENGMKLAIVEEIGLDEGEGALHARRQEVILNGDFGGVRFGQGNDAADGNLDGDLSGTAVIQPMASNSAALGYSSANYNGFDPGRGERIRYDSPNLEGAVISAQLGENAEMEVGLRFNTSFDGDDQFRVGAFIANTDTDTDSLGVLVAYKIVSGLNFAVVISSKDNAAGLQDGDFTAFKVGYTTGKHAVSLVLGTSENPGNAVETDAFGVAYVYMLDKGVELYSAVQDFKSDNNAVDEDFIVFGTRVKF